MIFKKIINWVFPPPIPETSDVVSVKIIRRNDSDELFEYELSGESASKWGFYVVNRCPNYKFTQLLSKWKKTKL